MSREVFLPIDSPFRSFTTSEIVKPFRSLLATDQGQVARKRRELRSVLEGMVSEVEKLCGDRLTTLPTWVRNLVATADADDVVIYRLLVEYTIFADRWKPTPWISDLLSSLPNYTPQLVFVQQLLLTNRPPTRLAERVFSAHFPYPRKLGQRNTALRHIACRDFSLGQKIDKLLEDAQYSAEVRRQLEEAVFRPHDISHEYRQRPLEEPRSRALMRKIPDEELRAGLLFLASNERSRNAVVRRLPPRLRSGILTRLPERDTKELIESLAERGLDHVYRLFPNVKRTWFVERLDVGVWAKALMSSTTLDDRRHILKRWPKGKRAYLLQVYLYRMASAEIECPPDMVSVLLADLGSKRLASRLDLFLWVVASVPSGEELKPIILSVLQEVTPAHGDFESLNSLLSDPRVHACLNEENGRGVLHDLFSRVFGKWPPGSNQELAHRRQLFLGDLVTPDLSLLTAVYPAEIPPEDFECVLAKLQGSRVRQCAALLKWITPTGEPSWLNLLQDLKKRKCAVPELLVSTISQAGADHVLSAVHVFPGLFARAACRTLQTRQVIETAFRFPAVGVVADRLVSRRKRLKELSWVREKWADQPNKQTAYEVALLFSLADSLYLVDLANKVVLPEKDQLGGKQFDDLYRTYQLPKKKGGLREIAVPDEKLKRLQRRLLDGGFSGVRLSRAAHGFRKGRSVLTNATPHVRQPMVVNVDIDSFFSSTKYDQVVRACRRLAGGKLSERAVRFVADLCSYGGSLPTGAPTSPAIGNIVLDRIDRILLKVAGKFGIQYTRYADDLTFSGHGETHRILPFVQRLLEELGYHLDRAKVNIFRKGRRQLVTGLVVNNKPNLPRRLRRRLRAAVHHRTTGKQPFWHDRAMDDSELHGRISFLHLVQPLEAQKHLSALKGK